MTDTHRSPAAQSMIAVVGNPNTGKSTLFNVLTGLRQKTANYPGVTVERHTGTLKLAGGEATLVDVPGAYSLTAHSPDELVSTDVLLGKIPGEQAPDAVLIVIDATNLRRNLFMATQVLELGLPVVVALNMADLAHKRGIDIDAGLLAEELETPVIAVTATHNQGIAELKQALQQAINQEKTAPRTFVPEIRHAASALQAEIHQHSGISLSLQETERTMIDAGGAIEARLLAQAPQCTNLLLAARDGFSKDASSVAAIEARGRYAWIDRTVEKVEHRGKSRQSIADVIDRITSHPLLGAILFFTVMATVFQAVFSWAGPLMDMIDSATVSLSSLVASSLPEGALSSLIVDGMIAGVGSVIIFLPQILILFAFIIFLEDSGYMARAAFLMDRLMRACGLSGQSFIPMLSSFACAVPGIMATRVIPDPRDRLATMLAAPFMTCSARLPVYALLIAAFVPDITWYGVFNLQGLVLFGLYMLGITGGILTALIMKRFALKGPTPTFLIEIPPYRWPNFKSMTIRLIDRGRIFLYRAGTIIFTVAVVIWALVYFPRPQALLEDYATQRTELAAVQSGEALTASLRSLDQTEASALLEQSYLGRAGKILEPAFTPLGWDWKVTAGVIASFPAREVVVAVMGTIYAVGDEVDETDPKLLDRLRRAKRPDGSLVFTTGMAVGLMIFYAFCLQCMATIAIMRRETGGWKWPIAAWVYMTSIGYIGAFLAYQLI